MKTYFAKIVFLLTMLLFINYFFVRYVSAQNKFEGINYLKQLNAELITPVRLYSDKFDNLYVSESENNCIIKYDASGNFKKKITLNFSPLSIVVDEKGDIYAGDKNTGLIYRITKNGQTSVFFDACQFPAYMDMSPNGDLYIADSQLQQIFVTDKSGKLKNIIGQGKLIYPSTVKYDGKNKRILVGEHGGIGNGFTPVCRVSVFSLNGDFIANFGKYGNGDGEFYRIQGITIGKCDNIYVCDTYLGQISVFDENFNFITKFGKYGKNPGELDIPLDITFNSKEEIFVSSMNNGSVEVFKMSDSLPSSNMMNSDKVLCPGENAEINIRLTGTSPWTFTYTVDNTNPVEITTASNPYVLTVSDPGIYEIVSLTDANNSGYCYTGSAVIKKYDNMPNVDVSAQTTSFCKGDSVKIRFDLKGTPPWSYAFTSDIINENIKTYDSLYYLYVKNGGKYRIDKVTDAYCSSNNFIKRITLTEYPKPVSDFDVAINELKVEFINRSENSESYIWSFGDETQSFEENPVHTYMFPGNYNVELKSANSLCGENTVIKSLNIESASAVTKNDVYKNQNIKLYPNPSNGNFHLDINENTGKDVMIEIFSMSGKLIYSEKYKPKVKHKKINIINIPDGIYMLKVKSSSYIEPFKLVIQNKN
ncbi:MAG: T9SS type A sorting domain-containing protein [Chlorobi bacterium]|nr:T9SS type A sorting domain-containing protein [Chlorobiota bacterium]